MSYNLLWSTKFSWKIGCINECHQMSILFVVIERFAENHTIAPLCFIIAALS